MNWTRWNADRWRAPQTRHLTLAGKALYPYLWAYSADQETDGELALDDIGMVCTVLDIPLSAIDDLCQVGVLERDGDVYVLAGYRESNPAPRTRRPSPGDGSLKQARRAWNRLRRILAPRILARDGSVCAVCGATERLTIDHVVPLAGGGSNDERNLRVLCRPCNSRKGARA